ncbi:MAG: hypothetical protein JNM18_24670 [Planctomycetaceae bacterium]|nr:hypothetical protein [Planctomycetaceae bacterium]
MVPVYKWCQRHPIKIALMLLLLGSFFFLGGSEIPEGVEMIFWESQSWDGSGRRSRITLWQDGRSEILLTGFYTKPLQPGWSVLHESSLFTPPRLTVKRENAISQEEGKAKFSAALAAGFADLKTFPITYADGGGTLIGIQVKGQLSNKTIPLFLGLDKYTLNYRRYKAVQSVLNGFDDEPSLK